MDQPRFTLRQLRYFLAAVEHGGIRPAAERIAVSEPAMSGAIAELEAVLGVRLFVRRRAHGLVPTRAGERLAEEARLLIERASGLERLARGLGEEPVGTLVLGCLVTVAPRFLPRLLRGFGDLYPQARLVALEDDQEGLIAGLKAGRLDLALTYDLQLDAAISFRPIAAVMPKVLLAPDHRLAGQAEIAIAALAEEPFALLDLPLSRDYFLGLFDQAGVRPAVAYRSGQVELVRGLVAAGLAWSLFNLVPEHDRAADGGQLVARRLAPPARVLELGLAARKDAPMSALAGRLVELATALVGAAPLR